MTEVTGRVTADFALLDLATVHERYLDVSERRLRHTVLLEDVPRHAARIGARKNRLAHRPAGDGIRDHVQRVLDARDRHVVVVSLGQLRDRVRPVDVVTPDIVDLALVPDDEPPALVLEIVPTRCAFHIAPADEQENIVGGIGHTAAPGTDHARRELRVGAIDLVGTGAVERARARDLRDGAVVDVLNLRVQLGVLIEAVVRKGAGGIALVRTLVVVQRAEVVTV